MQENKVVAYLLLNKNIPTPQNTNFDFIEILNWYKYLLLNFSPDELQKNNIILNKKVKDLTNDEINYIYQIKKEITIAKKINIVLDEWKSSDKLGTNNQKDINEYILSHDLLDLFIRKFPNYYNKIDKLYKEGKTKEEILSNITRKDLVNLYYNIHETKNKIKQI